MASSDELLKEMMQLQKNLNSICDGQAELEINDTDHTIFKVILRPKGGYYQGGKFTFQLNVPYDYPSSPPDISCLTKYTHHPNISETGVCVSITGCDFDTGLRLEHYVNGLLFLLYNPNFDDMLNCLEFESEVEFKKVAQDVIKRQRIYDGENVDEVEAEVEETADEVIEKVETLTVSPIVVAEVKPEAVSEEQKSNGTASSTENSNTAIVTVQTQTSINNTLPIAPAVEGLTKTEMLLKNLEITAETITAAPVPIELTKEANIALTISTSVKIENEAVKTPKRNLITPNSTEILV